MKSVELHGSAVATDAATSLNTHPATRLLFVPAPRRPTELGGRASGAVSNGNPEPTTPALTSDNRPLGDLLIVVVRQARHLVDHGIVRIRNVEQSERERDRTSDRQLAVVELELGSGGEKHV